MVSGRKSTMSVDDKRVIVIEESISKTQQSGEGAFVWRVNANGIDLPK